MRKLFLLFIIQVVFCLNTFALRISIDTLENHQNRLFNYNNFSTQSILNQSWDYQIKKNYLNIQGSFYNYSNTVNNEIAYSILFKSFIDDAKKSRTFNKLRQMNTYEDEARWSIQYGHYIPKNKLTYSVAYTYRNMRSMVFNKEPFQFVFAGNKMFEDDTINIDQLAFNYVGYNQLQIGISKTIIKPNANIIIGGAISLLQSPQYLSLKAKKSSIYTAPYGEYLDVAYNLEAQQANDGAPIFFSFKGVGMSADLHVSYQRKHEWMLRFNVFDIGFIKYIKETHSYKGDSSIRFEGIVIDNITNFTTPAIFSNFKSDSLFKILNIENSSKSFYYLHPVTFQLAFSKSIIHHKGMITIGIQQKTIPKYYPNVWGKFSYYCKRNFVPSVHVSFGGYSYYNVGFELLKRIKPVDISVGTNNILGLISPKHFTSSSLYVRASVIF